MKTYVYEGKEYITTGRTAVRRFLEQTRRHSIPRIKMLHEIEAIDKDSVCEPTAWVDLDELYEVESIDANSDKS